MPHNASNSIRVAAAVRRGIPGRNPCACPLPFVGSDVRPTREFHAGWKTKSDRIRPSQGRGEDGGLGMEDGDPSNRIKLIQQLTTDHGQLTLSNPTKSNPIKPFRMKNRLGCTGFSVFHENPCFNVNFSTPACLMVFFGKGVPVLIGFYRFSGERVWPGLWNL